MQNKLANNGRMVMRSSKTSLGLTVSMLIGASLPQSAFANRANNVDRLAASWIVVKCLLRSHNLKRWQRQT